LKNLHSLVFGGRVTKQTKIKDNLLAFSGVVYEENESRDTLAAKIARLHKSDVRDILIFFGQDPSGEKEDIVQSLAKFLEKPEASDKDFAPKKKRSTSRSKSPAKVRMINTRLYCRSYRHSVQACFSVAI
jgi:hypothetical protein